MDFRCAILQWDFRIRGVSSEKVTAKYLGISWIIIATYLSTIAILVIPCNRLNFVRCVLIILHSKGIKWNISFQ